jgi:hypothetical protein
MRFLLGWTIKLSFAGLIYMGVTGGFGDITVPDTVMGYKVPDGVKRQLESANKIKELGADTNSGFKKIGDSFGR